MARLFLIVLMMIVMAWGNFAAGSGADATLLESFDSGKALKGVTVTSGKAKLVRGQEGGKALKVAFDKGDAASVMFGPREGTWDWSAFSGVAIDVTNPGKDDLRIRLSVTSLDEDGKQQNQEVPAPLPAGEKTTLRFYFANAGAGPYWGMRGIPVYGPISYFGTRMSTAAIFPARVVSFSVSCRQEHGVFDLLFDDLRGFAAGSDLEPLCPYPFIDTLGQYIHADWPGKVKSEAELAERVKSEENALETSPLVSGQDRFGGWADGPQLQATGWFRAEKLDGKWWLVTPEGHLFLSMGMNCLYEGVGTFVEGREKWFEALPGPEGAYAGCWGSVSGVHSMGEAIGGKGRTFNFYLANLIRKYGPDYSVAWRERSYARLRSWGFNTIGNWSNGAVLQHSPMPFTVTLGTGAKRVIEASTGFWGKMLDVYDPEFHASVDASFERVVPTYAGNPLCIGYFVDNELSWESIGPGVLASPSEQPAKKTLVAFLQEKYSGIDGLNRAWNASFKDWEALNAPGTPNQQTRLDMDEFVYAFSRRYFETVRDTLRKYAPNQLYLGCRFARGTQQVYRACGDVADVVSFNLYRPQINTEDWTGGNDLGKPILIGEYHFGALDRGMFHTGLQGADSQEDRAAKFSNYVRTVVDCPAFVGCHWFEYEDEPTTGRAMDGENFAIGFVSVADEPYAEMVEAARSVYTEMYSRRFGNKR